MSFLGGVKRIFGLTDDEMDEQEYNKILSMYKIQWSSPKNRL